MDNIYQTKFNDLTENDKKALAIAIQSLRAGDTLWHTDTSIWTWVLHFIQVVLDTESKTHPNIVMYVEFSRSNDKYGVGIIQTEAHPIH